MTRWAPPATASNDPAADEAAQIQAQIKAAVGPSQLKRNPETRNPQREP